jgi:hypothetical protein
VLEDTKDTYRWDTAALCQFRCGKRLTDNSVMEQFEPAVILLSGKAPDALVEVAAEYCELRFSVTSANPQAKRTPIPHMTSSRPQSSATTWVCTISARYGFHATPVQ